MPFQIQKHEPADQALHRVVGEQLDRAAADLRGEGCAEDERIHQFRKRCKKLRAVLQLLRPVLGETFSEEYWSPEHQEAFILQLLDGIDYQ